MSQSHDANGREYLKASEAKAGLIIELDNGFDCHPPGETELQECFTGLYFECCEGSHYIDGQLSDSHYIGIYKCQ